MDSDDCVRTSEWTVMGIFVRSMTVWLALQTYGEGGGGVRTLEVPWRSTTESPAMRGRRDPLLNEKMTLTLAVHIDGPS